MPPPKSASIPPASTPAPSAPLHLDLESGEVERIRAEEAKLRVEMERLRSDLARANADVGRLSGELSAAQARTTWLEGELSTANEGASEIARLKRELDDLKGKLSSAGRIGSTSGRELLDLREALNKKDKELLSLREQMSQRDKELLTMREQQLALEREKADVNDRLIDLTRERDEAAQEAGAAADRIADRERELVAERDKALQTLAAKHADRMTRLETKHAAALAANTSELANKEAEWETARRELEEAAAAARGELEETRARLDGEIARISEERDKLRAASEALSLDLALEKTRADKARAKWKDDKRSLEQARASLEAALAKIEEAEQRPIE
jgi:chromosome segregation ATPase